MKRTVGIIPCRFKSFRFPGKPLADIHGKPMMWHVYQQALKAKSLDAVYVATDDARIFEAGVALKLQMVMTRDDHVTGTDRVAECAQSIPADYYVNIQGDEPMIEPAAIDRVAAAIQGSQDSSVVASNAYSVMTNPSDVIDTNIVKVVLTMDDTALAFSRHAIPFPKDSAVTYLRQLGLYAFRRAGLEIFARHRPGRVERAEGVEMLRFIEHGYRVQMVEVQDDSIPVDTPADLERIRALMADKPSSPHS